MSDWQVIGEGEEGGHSPSRSVPYIALILEMIGFDYNSLFDLVGGALPKEESFYVVNGISIGELLTIAMHIPSTRFIVTLNCILFMLRYPRDEGSIHSAV